MSVFAVSVRNLLRDCISAPFAKSEQAGFEAANVRNGRPWHPHRFAQVGDDYYDFDMLAAETTFDVAFVGGLPVSAVGTWGKGPGTTLARNTTTPDAGAGCLEVQGGATAAAYFDFPAWAGHAYTLTLRARAGASGGWRVRVRDLNTREWLSGLVDPPDWVSADTPLATGTNSGSYATCTATFAARDSATIGGPETTFRVYLDGNGLTPVPLFDSLRIWPSINFFAIVGHTVPPSGLTFDLYGGATQPGDTLRVQAAIASPTCFGYVANGSELTRFSDRWYRLTLPNPPLEIPSSVGEIWLGQITFQLANEPSYPLANTTTLSQARSGAAGSESQSALRADLEVRSLDLRVFGGSVESADELRRAFRDTRYGARRALLIAPWRNAPTAFFGRFQADVSTQQEGYNAFVESIQFVEEPHLRLMP